MQATETVVAGLLDTGLVVTVKSTKCKQGFHTGDERYCATCGEDVGRPVILRESDLRDIRKRFEGMVKWRDLLFVLVGWAVAFFLFEPWDEGGQSPFEWLVSPAGEELRGVLLGLGIPAIVLYGMYRFYKWVNKGL